MEPIALCTLETVEIREYGDRGSTRFRRVTGHRYLDFAVSKSANCDLFTERWTISHLPSGHCVARGFRTIEPAVAAMVDIARLRNDWAVIEEEDASKETAEKVNEIVKKHDERAQVGQGRNGSPLRNNLNGYGEAQPA